MRTLAVGLGLAALLGGCALKSDVRRVQDEVARLELESARRDSARATQLREVIALQRQLMDSLGATQVALGRLKGDLADELYNIQQQLVQVQELTGQSQLRLSQLRIQLEARQEQLGPIGDSSAGAGPTAGGATSAEQMYEASLQQLRRGSPGTARLGFRELLRLHPESPRAPDAVYFIGESFAVEAPDSAAIQYTAVVERYPRSPRAAAALYKLGLLAERRNDNAAARRSYQRVVQQYPQSDEAALARDRLRALAR